MKILSFPWIACGSTGNAVEDTVFEDSSSTGIPLFPSSCKKNSVCRIIFLVWMTECMQETAGFDLYVLLVEEMQIQCLF